MSKFASCLKTFCICVCLSAIACCHGLHHGICAEARPTFRVLAATFPVYLFTRNICEGAKNVRVELLVPATAGCPHDYAPKPGDLRKLASADVLVKNGLGLESFLDKSIGAVAPDIAIVLADKNVPLVREANGAVNPHIFAAPRQAAIMAQNICAGLAAINPENAEIYKSNAVRYTRGLDELGRRLEKIGERAANKNIVLEHDALAYLAQNANLNIAAQIEEHVTAARLAMLVNRIKQISPALLAGDAQYSDRTLQTLARETGIPFATLDPCAAGAENAPLDYYQKVMTKNIETLEEYFD